MSRAYQVKNAYHERYLTAPVQMAVCVKPYACTVGDRRVFIRAGSKTAVTDPAVTGPFSNHWRILNGNR
jgi:hypothetical protein